MMLLSDSIMDKCDSCMQESDRHIINDSLTAVQITGGDTALL